MPSIVKREEFLLKLENVSPGLSKRDLLEQSGSYVFKDGELLTFNEETACRVPSGLNGITGAVLSRALRNNLSKRKEDEIKIYQDNDFLYIKGKGNRTHVRCDPEVVLPIEIVERPEKWRTLHPDFCEAINTVQQCAGKNQADFELTCVHIHPEWVEACDDFQVCRWPMKTGVKAPILVRQEGIQHIAKLAVGKYSVTDSWLHFKNGQGLVYSVRRYDEGFKYPDLTKHLDIKGKKVSFPRSVADDIEIVRYFAEENVDGKFVMVELKDDRLKVSSQGASGGHYQHYKIKFKGDLAFLIAPQLLQDLVKRHPEAQVSAEQLIVNAGSYVYFTQLSDPSTWKLNDEDKEEAGE